MLVPTLLSHRSAPDPNHFVRFVRRWASRLAGAMYPWNARCIHPCIHTPNNRFGTFAGGLLPRPPNLHTFQAMGGLGGLCPPAKSKASAMLLPFAGGAKPTKSPIKNEFLRHSGHSTGTMCTTPSSTHRATLRRTARGCSLETPGVPRWTQHLYSC